MSIFPRLKGFASRHRPITVLLCLVFVFALFLVVKGWIETPTDLGPRLVYIGRQDYGNIFGFDQYHSSDYFFATDMNSDELKTYFRGAKYIQGWPATIEGYGTNYLDFMTTHNHTEFSLRVYESTSATISNYQLQPTTKRYTVIFTDTDYGVAKQSL